MYRTRGVEALRFHLWSRCTRSLRAGLHDASADAPLFPVFAAGRGYIISNGLSSTASAEGVDLSGGTRASQLHSDIISAMEKLRTPETSLFHSFLQNCSTPTDIELALGVLTRLRTLKAVQSNQRSNFRDHVAELFVQACLRAQVTKTALKALWMHNIHGLTPSLKVAHLLLSYAKERKDVKFMEEVLRTMLANNVMPTSATADIVLRLLNDVGESALLLKLAREFHLNGIVFTESVYDICISSAANTGDVKQVFKIQQWRERHGVPQTTASAFSLAKAHLLRRRPQYAAAVLREQCPENEKKSKYLTTMVQVWPQELSRQKQLKYKASTLRRLQQDTVALVEALPSYGWHVSFNAAEEFGKGKAGP